MKYDVVIVGGGIAGLTSAAYLSKEGYSVLLCEKEEEVGGLVSSFPYKGFVIDGGIRSIENSGIVLPMIKQLGLDIDFVKSTVSLGVEDEVIRIHDESALEDYKELLISKFPDNKSDIENIVVEIKKIMGYMDILYGIDNPVFLDVKEDRKYFITKIIPWIFKYMFNVNKVMRLSTPVDEYLQSFTDNQHLIDVIGQHFFRKTPAFFALSYFSLYLDYRYPLGGTGKIVDVMEEFIKKHDGNISVNTEIASLDPEKQVVTTSKGDEIEYKTLIWAADLKRLYKSIDTTKIESKKIKESVLEKNDLYADMRGGDSILSVYMTVDLDSNYFKEKCTGHFFYTPVTDGLSEIPGSEAVSNSSNKEEILQWVKEYYRLTTYEVSIPVLRDESLAPPGKSALIISTLFDYDLVKRIKDMGWYKEFKELSEVAIIEAMESSIYPGFKDKIIDKFSSTPLTMESRTGNTDGAITGWAFTNSSIPVVHTLPSIAKSVRTPLPNIFQAGQWSYSPSGLPISILTGKIASDKVKKKLK